MNRLVERQRRTKETTVDVSLLLVDHVGGNWH